MTFVQWLYAHATAAIFWQAIAFCAMASMIIWILKIQKTPDNGVNFFELVQEPGSIPPRLAPERFAYIGTFVVTSIGFIFGVTRPGASLEGIATLTFTYGSLWVIGSGVKKFADRPAAPVIPPAAPQVVVQAPSANVPNDPNTPNPPNTPNFPNPPNPPNPE